MLSCMRGQSVCLQVLKAKSETFLRLELELDAHWTADASVAEISW